MKGTTNTRRQVVVDERLPEPIKWTLTVVGLLHPAEIVLLPEWFLFLGRIASM